MGRAILTGSPLWPAGHLPLKGGDRKLRCRPAYSNGWRKLKCKLISPLKGEMAGRPEGGAKKCQPLRAGR